MPEIRINGDRSLRAPEEQSMTTTTCTYQEWPPKKNKEIKLGSRCKVYPHSPYTVTMYKMTMNNANNPSKVHVASYE